MSSKKRKKEWFKIFAPSYLGEGLEIGLIPAKDPPSLLNRVIEVPLSEFTKQPEHNYVLVKLKVNKVEGESAYTFFKGHEYIREYLGTLVWKGNSRIDQIIDVTTTDGYTLRVHGLVVTHKINRSQEKAIRKIMGEIISKTAKQAPFEEFVKEILFGKIEAEVAKSSRKIAPPRHSKIIKSKVLSIPLNSPS